MALESSVVPGSAPLELRLARIWRPRPRIVVGLTLAGSDVARHRHPRIPLDPSLVVVADLSSFARSMRPRRRQASSSPSLITVGSSVAAPRSEPAKPTLTPCVVSTSAPSGTAAPLRTPHLCAAPSLGAMAPPRGLRCGPLAATSDATYPRPPSRPPPLGPSWSPPHLVGSPSRPSFGSGLCRHRRVRRP